MYTVPYELSSASLNLHQQIVLDVDFFSVQTTVSTVKNTHMHMWLMLHTVLITIYMIIYVLEYSTDQQVSLDRPAKAGENGLVWGSMEREGLITAKSSFN